MDENLSGLDREEEAYLHLTINDFLELVDKYGWEYLLKTHPRLGDSYVDYATS